MPSKLRVSAARYSLKSSTKQEISFGIPKNLLARSKLTGLWSTTVTLLPERASIVARFPPPQPSRRMFLASPKNCFHHFHVWESALAGRRALALKDLSFKVEAITGLFAFPDRDVTQFAVVSTENPQ